MDAAGKVWEYSLTKAGEELRPIVMALGYWGAQWVGSQLRDGELDAGLLMWDMRRFACVDEFPSNPVVIHFLLRDARAGKRAWWLVLEDGVADLCRDVPGREAHDLQRWLGTSPFASTRRAAGRMSSSGQSPAPQQLAADPSRD